MTQGPARPGGIRLSALTTQNLTRLSAFRKFLVVNHDEIIRRSSGYRISWSAFLASPEVLAMDFRDNEGKPISPRLATEIWRRVRKRNSNSITAITGVACQPLPEPDFEMPDIQTGRVTVDDRSRDNARIVSQSHLVRIERRPIIGRPTHADFSEVLFKKQVRPGSRQDTFVKLVFVDTKGRINRISDAAFRMARQLAQEDE